MDIGKILHNASVEVTEEMFIQADTESKDVMTFEEFADWYTYGGFEIVPWLELLDLRSSCMLWNQVHQYRQVWSQNRRK